MQASDFKVRVGRLTGNEIAALAAALRHEHHCADSEVAWWRATLAVSGALRMRHRTREASVAAHAVTEAVRHAAERAGVGETERSDVTMVARAAAEVARALVAAETVGTAAYLQVTQLLAPWSLLDLIAT